jgi:hypothetical protein
LVEQRPEEPCVPSSSLGGATTFKRVSGEIGIHAALRWLCRKAWRFKSSLTHHK